MSETAELGFLPGGSENWLSPGGSQGTETPVSPVTGALLGNHLNSQPPSGQG